jgi:hypothetical protein
VSAAKLAPAAFIAAGLGALVAVSGRWGRWPLPDSRTALTPLM